jgi:hypothetical protein
MPHEQDSRKKRKTPGPRRPEDKKGKRGRSMKVQKVAGSAKQPRKKKKALAPSRWQQEVPVKREPAAVAVDPARMFDAVPIEIFDEPSADAPFVDFKLEEQPMDDALREFLAVKQEPVRPTPPPPPVRIARPAFDFALPPDE